MGYLVSPYTSLSTWLEKVKRIFRIVKKSACTFQNLMNVYSTLAFEVAKINNDVDVVKI